MARVKRFIKNDRKMIVKLMKLANAIMARDAKAIEAPPNSTTAISTRFLVLDDPNEVAVPPALTAHPLFDACELLRDRMVANLAQAFP